ncbi:DUF4328 domain-containing protein [Pimelobacter simplex]|uniref:DUF4328 domain-containing protein n=1 Tax=Nocardioides simplex TaxID=2045 RepID=UPI003AAE03A6
MLPPRSPARIAPTGLAAATVALTGVVALTQVIRALGAVEAQRLQEAAVEIGVDPAMLTTTYDRTAWVMGPLLVAAWVVGCLWLQRARDNAQAISPGVRQRRQRAWIWFGWWVPFANLFVPYQLVKDVQRASVPPGREAGLGWWWAAWLVFLVLPMPISGGEDWQESPDLIDLLVTVEGVAAVAALVGGALWCRAVLRITSGQEEALRGPAPAPQPLLGGG